MDTLQSQLEALQKRNLRVEADKAWETSLFRKSTITILTYLTVGVFFVSAEFPNPWLSALVPAFGFLLSTLTMPLLKRAWLKYFWHK